MKDPRVYPRKHKTITTWNTDIYVAAPGVRRRRRVRIAVPAATTKAEALDFARRLRASLTRHLAASPPPTPLTMRQFVSDVWLAKRKPGWKATTWRSYEQIIRVHLEPAFGDLPLPEISAERIEEYRALKLAASPPPDGNTVNKHFGVLSKMFADAKLWRYVDENPMDFVENCRVARDPNAFRFLAEEEQVRVLATTLRLRPRWYPLFLTALLTGLRLGELAALRRSDFDLDAKILNVERAFSLTIEGTPKSGKHRPIPLRDELVVVLRAHLTSQPGDRVFLANDGSTLTSNNVKATWRFVQHKAGIDPVRFHDSRHTFASQLVIHDVSLGKVQALLGHSDQRTTQRYARLNVKSLRDAVDRLPAIETPSPAPGK